MKQKFRRIAMRYLAFLLAMSLAVPPVHVSAEETAGGITGGVTWSLSNGVLTISPAQEPESGYEAGVMRTDYGAESNLVPWYNSMNSITSLVVEDGVTTLGNRLFNNASNLSSISFPDGLTTIGDRCFSNCVSLTELHLPDSVVALGDTVFNGCTGLTEVDISNTQVSALGKKVFSACSGLTTITLPVLTSVGESCFGSSSGVSTNKLDRVNFCGSANEWSAMTVTTTGSGSGQTYNTQLLEVTIYCTDGIFCADSNYDAQSYTPEAYTTIFNMPLAWKYADGTLTLLGWGETPEYAEGGAPWNSSATSITSVVIDKHITSIGMNSFYGCNDLTCSYAGNFDTLRENSSQVGNEALFGDISAEKPDNSTITGITGAVNYTFNQTTGIMTLSGSGETASYEALNDLNADTSWIALLPQIKELVVEEGVTALGNRLFTAATQLSKVTISGSLTSIGARCFTDCTSLTEVVFPNTSALVTMGEVAFNGCINLETVNLGTTQISTLSRKVFAACPALTTLTIPHTVTSISADAFGSTSNVYTNKLEVIYYGGTLATWNNGSFVNNTGNTNITDGTCTVYCSDGIWVAGYQSVGGNLCYKLDDGTLWVRCNGAMPNYEECKTPWYANAADITAVVLEEGMTSIGSNAFDGCVNLTNVEVCQSITTVGLNAFADCTALSNVSYLGTVAQWNGLEAASGEGNTPLFSAVMNSGYSGVCGDHATWTYDQEAKTLIIDGTGPMWDWNAETYQNTPWSKFKTEIETIEFKEGITATGRYAFCYMEALNEIKFASTIEIIGGYGFCWNDTLETLTLPEGVRFISGRAFSRVESLKTVYLPSTLESVDMYAFMSNDNSVTISNVYYNGTIEDWAQVYVSTQGGNDKYLLPDNDTTWHYQKEYTYFSDVHADSSAWYKDAVYYLKDQEMVLGTGNFGINEAVTVQWVLNALYVRAGSSGAYSSGLNWAKAHGVVAVDVENTEEVSLNELAEMLYRTALYNGHAIDLGTGSALSWCEAQGYTAAYSANVEGQSADTVLTRTQAASILSAYLQSDCGSAARYNEMRNLVKTAYQAGGDGKMYILALHHAGSGKVGDSTLILMPGGELMLIDTFRSDGWTKYLKETLSYLGVTNLDYLVLSHGHDDHDSNLSNVVNYIYDAGYTIGNYWSAGCSTSSRETAAITLLEGKGGVIVEKKLRRGDQRTIGSGSNVVTVDILWPTASGISGDTSGGNDGSLTMKLTYGSSSYITAGDLFITAEQDILELYKDNPESLKADVMKTNHHGSYSSDCTEWVAAVDPKVMVTHSDDSGDSAQCYQYSIDGRAWYSSGRDGGVLVVMDGDENISVMTGYDTNLRQYLVS